MADTRECFTCGDLFGLELTDEGQREEQCPGCRAKTCPRCHGGGAR